MSKCKELVAAKQKLSVSKVVVHDTHGAVIHIQAKHWLQQSKMFSKQAETKESMLANMQALLTKIQMAETDAMVTNQLTIPIKLLYCWQVLEAYQAGIASIKDVTIDIDKVDQTMDQLEEVTLKVTAVIKILCTNIY